MYLGPTRKPTIEEIEAMAKAFEKAANPANGWCPPCPAIDIKNETMSNKQAYQLSDESLLKCMKDYLEWPSKYHPEYLDVLLKDYERRIVDKIERSIPQAPPPRTTVCSTLTNLTTGT